MNSVSSGKVTYFDASKSMLSIKYISHYQSGCLNECLSVCVCVYLCISMNMLRNECIGG